MASVLLIEAEAPLVRLMSWFLLEAGFEVRKAEGPEAAVTLAERLPTVIVFNTGLPPDEKTEAVRELRRVSPESRILDVTDPKVRPAIRIETGADDYLMLPFDADTFVERVRQLTT